jgi:DNA-directed RNA polymerase subunit RPC12/RpoP
MYKTESLNKCPLCGGNIELDHVTNELFCVYCKTKFTYEQLHSDTDISEASDYAEYHCSSCGAVLIADENDITSECAYCGSTSVMKNKLSGRYNSHYIIPFKLSAADAKRAFVSGTGTYTPRSFRTEDVIKDVNGIFFPFWLYDCCVSSRLKFRITDAYTKKTKNTDLDINISFSKIPVDASVRMDDNYMDNIEPFDYSELKPFDKHYLIGYKAERYDTDVKLMSKRSDKRVRKTFLSIARKKIAKQLHQILPENTDLKMKVSDLSYKYALFPVYLIRTEYKNKTRLFVVNGQTGKMSGRLPVSAFSIALNVFLGSFLVSLMGAGILKLMITTFLKLAEENDMGAFSVSYPMLFLIVFALFSIVRLVKIKDEIDIWRKIYGYKTDDANADNYIVHDSSGIVKR